MSKPATRPASKAAPTQPADSKGNTRIFTDVPVHVAQEFAILAIRRGLSKRALMAKLIMDAVTGK